MLKISDICILLSVAVAFVTTAFLWFQGVDTKQEALFTATWIPSILAFAIYFIPAIRRLFSHVLSGVK